MSDPVLAVEDLRKTFGGIVAVDGATFEVERGSITGLIGPNGAGKTTTFNCISGFYEPDGGTVRYDGTDIQGIMTPSSGEKGVWTTASALSFATLGLTGARIAELAAGVDVSGGALGAAALGGGVVGAGFYYGQEQYKERNPSFSHSRPFRLSQAGLARTFQITRELQGMTVLENLILAPKNQHGENLVNTWFRRGTVQAQERQIRDDAWEMLELLEIEHLAHEEAGNLSGGQRKLLELGRVLLTDPELILLDEPVAGVNPTLTRKLLNRIEELRDQGYTFLIVEHDMEVIMNLSDIIIVMSEGRKLMEGTPEEVQQDERVIDAYLGG
jgi:branched-chain amino acid transport system ATP-binding protein